MNDIRYLENVNLQKSDSITTLKLQNEYLFTGIEKKEKQIANKNTGLWIQGGINFVLGILTLIFSN